MKNSSHKYIQMTGLKLMAVSCLLFTLSNQGANAFQTASAIHDERVALAKSHEFPRLAALAYGGSAVKLEEPATQITLSKFNLVILGTWPGWGYSAKTPSLRDAVRSIKAKNSDILIGHYTILNEAYLGKSGPFVERATKLEKQNWWLQKANGERVRWTDRFNAWDINITEWSQPDLYGMRYPQWAADYYFRSYFGNIPEIDIWFFDNVTDMPFVKEADWKNIGSDQSNKDIDIQKAYRNGHASEWASARSYAPDVLLMGNTTSDLASNEYAAKLEAGMIECAMGASWSLEKQLGWKKTMERYQALTRNLIEPKTVVFGVCGQDISDYQFFRYAFTSSLMGDGYFAFNKNMTYSSWPWFDEYNVQLGKALESPQFKSRQDGTYRRLFERGLVIVNPTTKPISISIPQGFRRFYGTQDPIVNNGNSVVWLTVQAKDGIVLVRI